MVVVVVVVVVMVVVVVVVMVLVVVVVMVVVVVVQHQTLLVSGWVVDAVVTTAAVAESLGTTVARTSQSTNDFSPGTPASPRDRRPRLKWRTESCRLTKAWINKLTRKMTGIINSVAATNRRPLGRGDVSCSWEDGEPSHARRMATAIPGESAGEQIESRTIRSSLNGRPHPISSGC